MRPLTLVTAAVAALACAVPASASIPDSGYVIFKESRLTSVTEVRAKGTGNVSTARPPSLEEMPAPTRAPTADTSSPGRSGGRSSRTT